MEQSVGLYGAGQAQYGRYESEDADGRHGVMRLKDWAEVEDWQQLLNFYYATAPRTKAVMEGEDVAIWRKQIVGQAMT